MAAGLLHNVYEHGDFGDGRKGSRRRDAVGSGASLAPRLKHTLPSFQRFLWNGRPIRLRCDNPNELASIDRAVLLILFADHLEHLLDLDVLYYRHAVQLALSRHCKIAAETSGELGLRQFATELREAIRRTEFAELSVKRH